MRHSRFTLAIAFLLVLPPMLRAQVTYEITITAPQANVRVAPNLQAGVVTSIKAGAVLRVLGKEDTWYRVQVPGLEQNQGIGFIHESVAKIRKASVGAATADSNHTADVKAATGSPETPPEKISEKQSLRPEQMPGYRFPAKAQFYSYFVPGGGHVYTGDTGTGAAYFVIGVGGFVLGRTLSKHFEETRGRFYDAELGAVSECIGSALSSFFCEHPGIPRYIGYGLLGLSWVAGISDAPKSAERMNAKRGILINTGLLEPRIESASDGRTYLGATLYFRKEGN